jgi:heparanase 1
VRSVLATLGARNALVQPATYVSFNLDWHYDGEEYPAWRGCSVANMSLSEPNLVFLAKSLAPAVLRVGGSEGDLVVYETPTSPCPPDPNRTLFCLTMARWAEINAFAAATGNKVAFGLNAMSGRTNKTCPHCPWDPTNAIDFLKYSQAQGITPAFFEFGNELTPYVAWEQYAKDVLVLRGLLDSVWPDAATRPKLVSNDANPDSAYLQNLLNATKGAIDVATWHLYSA